MQLATAAAGDVAVNAQLQVYPVDLAPDRRNLQTAVRHEVVPRVAAAIDAAPGSVLLTEAAPLARYGCMELWLPGWPTTRCHARPPGYCSPPPGARSRCWTPSPSPSPHPRSGCGCPRPGTAGKQRKHDWRLTIVDVDLANAGLTVSPLGMHR